MISLFICKLFRFKGLHPPLFLCYLLQNNYRNHGDLCLADCLNEKWKQWGYKTGSKVRHCLSFVYMIYLHGIGVVPQSYLSLIGSSVMIFNSLSTDLDPSQEAGPRRRARPGGNTEVKGQGLLMQKLGLVREWMGWWPSTSQPQSCRLQVFNHQSCWNNSLYVYFSSLLRFNIQVVYKTLADV